MKILSLLLLLISPALAQQQPSLLDQRIATQIGNLVIQNTSQGVLVEDLQAKLTAALARVKELETLQGTPPKPPGGP